ncbi:hypothetical protein K439DRAFT_1631775 [Ramaria rubella]|nr:hypothetical protein K439DRAFT_1631775 [Ramaria rubella]
MTGNKSNETQDVVGPSIPNHACLTMNMSDRLRLIRFPEEIVCRVRTALDKGWVRGIQNERKYANSHEFKLYGNPWDGQGSEAISSRIAMMAVLSALYHQGWILVIAADISKKMADKDSLIFRQSPAPTPCEFISLSFNTGDKLRLMGEDIAPEILGTIRMVLGKTVQNEEWKIDHSAYEFKLYGRPWYARSDIAVKTRVLLLDILDAMVAYGYDVYASVDLSTGKGERGRDTDSWFLKRAKVMPGHG